MELVILAAGMGSRFGGLKQIEPIDEYGNFILDYSVYDAIKAGFESVIFVIKEELYDDFRNTVGKRIEDKIKTKYVFQKLEDLPDGYNCPDGRIKPWGTAHAVLAVRDIVEDDFIMINADDFYGRDAFITAANYFKSLEKGSKGRYANIVYSVENTMTENGSVKRAVCFSDDNNNCIEMIESTIEKDLKGNIIGTELENPSNKRILKPGQFVSMNMFAFTKDIIDDLARLFPIFLEKSKNNLLSCEYLIPSVVTQLFKEGKASLKLLSTSAVWYGITYKQDKDFVVSSLKKLVDSGEYTKGLWIK